jgi:hypothetical protein
VKVTIGDRSGRDVFTKIVVNNRQLPDVTAEAIEALAARNDPPEIFVRAGRLVRVREDENGPQRYSRWMIPISKAA